VIRPIMLQGISFAPNRSETEAHNDNTSSIFAWNDGRLDAIAGPFGLLKAVRGSQERRDR
jgi:hypothetical protein